MSLGQERTDIFLEPTCRHRHWPVRRAASRYCRYTGVSNKQVASKQPSWRAYFLLRSVLRAGGLTQGADRLRSEGSCASSSVPGGTRPLVPSACRSAATTRRAAPAALPACDSQGHRWAPGKPKYTRYGSAPAELRPRCGTALRFASPPSCIRTADHRPCCAGRHAARLRPARTPEMYAYGMICVPE